jgi:ComF family protein
LELHFRFARSAVAAHGAVLDVIHRYKYNQALWFEPFLVGLLIRQAQPVLALETWDMIVPVPLHATRKRARGFNQAERLANCLSRATGIPANSSLLARIEPTPSQTRLTRTERAANIARAFALRPGRKLARGTRAIVVDDVFTTGATTSACARVLRAAGAADVGVWTLARGGF